MAERVGVCVAERCRGSCTEKETNGELHGNEARELTILAQLRQRRVVGAARPGRELVSSPHLLLPAHPPASTVHPPYPPLPHHQAPPRHLLCMRSPCNGARVAPTVLCLYPDCAGYALDVHVL